MTYKLERVLSDGIVALSRGGTPPRLWTRGKIRKPVRCAVTGDQIEKGQQAFRPLDQSCMYRMERISLAAIGEMAAGV